MNISKTFLTNSRFNARTFLAILIVCGQLCFARAASYVYGLSPNYPRTEQEAVLKGVLLFALEGAAPGDRITFYDALNEICITKFTIPEGKLFQANARARAHRLGSEIVALKAFLTAEHGHRAEMTSALFAPRFLDFAATQLRHPGESLQVILIGSPFYMNPDEPAWNMDMAYPSDGAIAAQQRDSVFGTALKKGIMRGVTVHYAYLKPCFVNDFHLERTRHALAAFIGQQEGVLSTFAPDPSLAIQRAQENIQQPCVEAQLDPNDTKVEMRQVVRRGIPFWFGPTNFIQQMVQTTAVPHATSVPAAIATTQVASFPITPTRDKIGVGLMWAAPEVDLDLHIKATPQSREIYYGNTATPEGRYFHDYRTGNMGVDYEYSELQGELIDLSRVEAWINYFSGHAAVRGIVVLFYQGKSFYGEFELAASEGNHGLDSTTRQTSKYWARLDLVKLLTNGSPVPPLRVHR